MLKVSTNDPPVIVPPKEMICNSPLTVPPGAKLPPSASLTTDAVVPPVVVKVKEVSDRSCPPSALRKITENGPPGTPMTVTLLASAGIALR